MYFFRKTTIVILEFVLGFINLLIAILSNIVVYEVSTGLHFDFSRLLSAKLFWIIVALQLVYFIAYYVINRFSDETDKRIDDAYISGEIILIKKAVDYSERGDFSSARKTMRIVDKFRKRRRR